MSKFTCNVLRAAISPEWLAKTYSEYLLTCAKSKLDFISSINDAIADDSLDVVVDTISDQYVDLCQPINDKVSAKLLELNQDVNTIPADSAEFDELLREVLFTKDAGSEPATYHLTADGQGLVQFSSAFNGSTSHTYTVAEMEQFINTYRKVSRDDIVAENAIVRAKIQALTDSVLSDNDLSPNVPLTMSDGYVNMGEAVKAIIRRGALGDEYQEFSLAAVSSDDSSVGNLTFDFRSIMDDLKGSVASTITWAQAFEAATISGLSDRMVWFENTCKNYFNDFNDKVNASINSVRSVLNNLHNGVSELIDIAGDMLGWDKLTQESAVVSETDVYAYTGASPLGDVDLHTAKGVATLAAGAVVATGKAVWSLIKKGAKKLWGKIRPLAKAVTTDPEDIAVTNKDGAYTVDGMSYNCKHVTLSFYAKDVSTASDLVDWVEKHKDSWFAFKTYFGEVIFNMSHAVRALLNLCLVDVCWQLKPRCLNHKTAYDYGLILHTTASLQGKAWLQAGTFTETTISKWYNSNNIYAGDDDDEKTKIMGFEDGLLCMQGLFEATLQEMAASSQYDLDVPGFIANWGGSDLVGLNFNENWTWFKADREFSPATAWTTTDGRLYPQSVTNKSFLQTLTGYAAANEVNSDAIVTDERFGWASQRVRYQNDEDDGQQTITYNGKTRTDYNIASLIMMIILNQAVERMENPMDYSYIPYSNDNYVWDEPRYKIKTDQQNAAIADIFVSAIIAVVVIVLAVVVCKSLLKVFKLKKYAKLQNNIHALDGKMWGDKGVGGEQLTWKTAWKYRRQMNKISKLQSAASGFASSMSSNSAIVDKIKESTGEVITKVRDSLMLGPAVKPTDWGTENSFTLADKMNVQDSAYISSLYYGVFRQRIPQD